MFKLFTKASKILAGAFLLKLLLSGLLVFVGYNYYESRGFYQADNLPKITAKPREFDKTKHSAFLHLYDAKGEFFCTAFVIDAHYAATAAHCLVGQANEEIHLSDAIGNPLKETAKTAGYYSRTDVGVITGDFSNFNQLPIETNSPALAYSQNRKLLACGFPLGQKQLVCVPFVTIGIEGFQVKAIGAALYPGMSGGPIIDTETGVVIGLNSAMGYSDKLIEPSPALGAPTIGLYGIFGIEPESK